MTLHRTSTSDPAQWRWSTVLRAPHRLAFAWAQTVLLFASSWWLMEHLARSGWLSAAWSFQPMLSSTVVHSVAMTFGFIPLFFSGFLFTAGPKWLGVAAPSAQALLPATTLQGAGWLLWLVGAYISPWLAVFGGGLAWSGLSITTTLFIRLLFKSAASEKVHATLVAAASSAGLVCLTGAMVGVMSNRWDLTRVWTLTGLWMYAVWVYVVVAHRMILFFTSSALQSVAAWRPMWVLYFLVFAVTHKGVSLWVDFFQWNSPVWTVLSSFLMLVTGILLLWLALIWGMVQNLKIRLLAMLHIGFLWLGFGFLLDATGHFWTHLTGDPGWALGAMHATTMGFMGSLLLAMVTRVSCGHGGRPLVADTFVWSVFWLLQLATCIRILVTVFETPWYATLTVLTAGLWLLVTGACE